MILQIIKFGGSCITLKKENKHELNVDLIRDLGIALRDYLSIRKGDDEKKLVIVCGVGPFGHDNVIKYDLIKNPRQPDAIRITREACDYVGQSVASLIQDTFGATSQKRVVYVPAYSIFTRDGAEQKLIFDEEQFTRSMSKARILVTAGNMVTDSMKEYSVLSGDTIISHLYHRFEVKRALLGTDVSGVYTCDPNLHPNEAKLIRVITRENLLQVLSHHAGGSSATSDVTGGMRGKLAAMFSVSEQVSGERDKEEAEDKKQIIIIVFKLDSGRALTQKLLYICNDYSHSIINESATTTTTTISSSSSEDDADAFTVLILK